jgi:transcriptional regulator with XRE-family HTH domain
MGRAGGKAAEEIDFDLRLGQRIRRLRTRFGVGQAALARDVGVTAPQLHAVETGRVRCSPWRLALIAERLGVRVADLVPKLVSDR